MKITYWSDYACPYCYIGETRLKKAIAELPDPSAVELTMKSFRLDPDAPDVPTGDTTTRFSKKYRISPMLATHQIERISQMGEDEGLEFRYATTKFTNTMDAHRLTKLAQSKGDPALADKVIEGLFAAYFGKNEELSDHAILRNIAIESGLNSAEVDALLSSDQFRQEVLNDETDAALNDVHAVPFFVIGGKYEIPGAQTVSGMKAALLQALSDEENAGQDFSGMVCGPDGCR